MLKFRTVQVGRGWHVEEYEGDNEYLSTPPRPGICTYALRKGLRLVSEDKKEIEHTVNALNAADFVVTEGVEMTLRKALQIVTGVHDTEMADLLVAQKVVSRHILNTEWGRDNFNQVIIYTDYFK